MVSKGRRENLIAATGVENIRRSREDLLDRVGVGDHVPGEPPLEVELKRVSESSGTVEDPALGPGKPNCLDRPGLAQSGRGRATRHDVRGRDS